MFVIQAEAISVAAADRHVARPAVCELTSAAASPAPATGLAIFPPVPAESTNVSSATSVNASDSSSAAMAKCLNFGCGKPALKRCSRCKTARYCSTTCQSSHWSIHKRDCAVLRFVFASHSSPNDYVYASVACSQTHHRPDTSARFLSRSLTFRPE